MLHNSFSWPHGKKAAFSLTFDDARHTQADNGFAVLGAHGVRATFYVLTGGVEARLDAWKAAVAAGHEIGNHTVHHPCSCNHAFSRANSLEDYSLERMENEIREADAKIQSLLGVTPRSFAYPCGQSHLGRGTGAKSYIPFIAANFVAGRAGGGPMNDPEVCDLAQLQSQSADGVDLAQLKSRIDRAIQDERWLILHAHEVNEQGITPEVLDALCKYVNERQDVLWTDTVANIAECLRKSRLDEG